MRLLEEFWYGNIEPTEYDTNACKEYKEVLHPFPRTRGGDPCPPPASRAHSER